MSEMDDLFIDNYYDEMEFTAEFDAIMRTALMEYAETFVLLRQAELAEREIH